MKIAFVNFPGRAFSPPPAEGSIEICFHELARRVARSGPVIAYSVRGDLPKQAWCDGVEYRRISDSNERTARRLSGIQGMWRAAVKLEDYQSTLFHIGYSAGIALDLRLQGVDAVHIVNLSQFVPIIRLLNPEIKIGLHMQCEWLTRLDRKVIEARLKKANLIFGCSEYITDQVRSSFPQFAGRCRTLFNGVDTDHFSAADGHAVPANRKCVLWVGRYSPEKGLHVLIDAFAEVVKSCPEAHLQLIGTKGQLPYDVLLTCDEPATIAPLKAFASGDYLDHLKQRVANLNLGSHVTLGGPVSHTEIVKYYRQADVLANPSFFETFGMTMAEAMACEVPVVATRVGTQVVEHETCGLLVKPNQPGPLAVAILRLLGDEELRKRLGKAGRQRVLDLYSFDRLANYMMEQYE